MSDTDNTEQNTNQQPEVRITDQQWEDDFDKESLTIPYKREEAVAEVAEEEKEEQGEEEEEVEQYIETPIVTAEDPGEYKPADYSFEVEIKGKTVKVTSAEQADQLADDNADDLDARTLGKLIREGLKIDTKLEKDKAAWDVKKATYDTQKQLEDERQENVSSMMNEFEYLVGKGLLPKISKEYRDANWSDPEVAKQPGVKEQLALLSFIAKENNVRAKAGVKPFSSVVDAYNAMQTEKGRKQTEEARKTATEARKNAGAKVAGTTTTPANLTNAPKGIAVGRPNVFKSTQAQWDN